MSKHSAGDFVLYCFSFYIVERVVLYYWTSTVKYYQIFFATLSLLCSFISVKLSKNLSNGWAVASICVCCHQLHGFGLLPALPLPDSSLPVLSNDQRHLKYTMKLVSSSIWPLLSSLFISLKGKLSCILQILSRPSQ